MLSDYSNQYKYRTGTKKLTLTNMNGSPLKNTEVSVKQIKHEFLFGGAEFSSIPFANNELNGDDNEKAQERFDKFLDLFNYVTLPFYWNMFEPAKGQPQTQRVKKAAKWLISKGCILKGHPLCWHTLTAPWLLDMSNPEILTAQINRIHRDVEDFKGLIDIWDVINEVVIMPVFDKYDNGITRLCKDIGRVRTVQEMFSATKKSNPDAVLLINDFNTSEHYETLIDECLGAGVPIDAIGIQSHMHQGYWGVEKTHEVLKRFERFNLPIHFTENTLVSGHIMPSEIVDLNDYKVEQWPSTPDGEDRQAEEALIHYKTLFAHPLVESITWWDFVDGHWLGAPSGLITKDNRVKPVYHELHKLIKDEWWTKQFNTATDDSGSVIVSGFLGEYEISCSGKKMTFDINKDKADLNIVI